MLIMKNRWPWLMIIRKIQLSSSMMSQLWTPQGLTMSNSMMQSTSTPWTKYLMSKSKRAEVDQKKMTFSGSTNKMSAWPLRKEHWWSDRARNVRFYKTQGQREDHHPNKWQLMICSVKCQYEGWINVKVTLMMIPHFFNLAVSCQSFKSAQFLIKVTMTY